MDHLTDQQLLQDYARHQSEAAFAELVRRHVDLVYSAALRMVCDSHLAQDVTQNVFIALAKSAPQLTERPVLSGWLHRTAQYLAAKVVRSEVRRRTREQEAVAMNELNETDATWETIAPHLDDALGKLGETDRDALLLRYFERKSAREMAAILGTSEVAAQKRVNRAEDRLRELFTKQRMAIGASGVAALISANAVQSAPVGLASSISTTLAGTAVSSSTLIATTVTALQKGLIVAGLAAIAGIGVYATYKNSALGNEVRSFQQQRTPLQAQLHELQIEYNDATNQLAALPEENASSNDAEMVRLRARVAQLKAIEAQRKNDPIASAAKDWLERVKTLKDYLDKHPEEKIPELKYLADKDWLEAADREYKFQGTNDLDNAVQSLKFSAVNEVGDSVLKAANEYSQANNGKFPDHLSELQPYCDPDIESLLEQQYEIAPSSIVHDTAPNTARNGVTIRYDIPQSALGQWVITRKVRPNPTSTTRFAIYFGGFATWQSLPGTDNSQ